MNPLEMLNIAKESRAASVCILLSAGKFRVSVPDAIEIFHQLPEDTFKVLSINFE